MIRLLVTIDQPVGDNQEAVAMLVQKVLEDTTGEQNVTVKVLPVDDYWEEELKRCQADPAYFYERYWKVSGTEATDGKVVVQELVIPSPTVAALEQIAKGGYQFMVWDGEAETANKFLGKYNEAWIFKPSEASPYRIWVDAAQTFAALGELIAMKDDECIVEPIKQPVKWPGRREASEHLMKALGTEGVHWQYADFPGVKLKLLETGQIVNRGEVINIGEYGHLWKALPEPQ